MGRCSNRWRIDYCRLSGQRKRLYHPSCLSTLQTSITNRYVTSLVSRLQPFGRSEIFIRMRAGGAEGPTLENFFCRFSSLSWDRVSCAPVRTVKTDLPVISLSSRPCLIFRTPATGELFQWTTRSAVTEWKCVAHKEIVRAKGTKEEPGSSNARCGRSIAGGTGHSEDII